VSAWLGFLVWALAAHALHLRGRRQLLLALRARHEVRGPLCTAQLALDGLEPSARVEAIGMELRRAALALDDLAGLPRGGAIEALDLGGLLADAAHAWHALADAHGVALAIESGAARVVGDRLRLAQACANLVANAIEHGGGHVRVSSSAAGGLVSVEVADLGPGLPAPVTTLLAAARGRRSARGHGLAIAAAVAERHGGHLTSLPAPKGARVVLELPEAGSAVPRSPRLRRPAPRFSWRPLRRDHAAGLRLSWWPLRLDEAAGSWFSSRRATRPPERLS
jgi:signal transduction histidine kinase